MSRQESLNQQNQELRVCRWSPLVSISNTGPPYVHTARLLSDAVTVTTEVKHQNQDWKFHRQMIENETLVCCIPTLVSNVHVTNPLHRDAGVWRGGLWRSTR